MLFYYFALYLVPSLVFSIVAISATWRRARWWILDFLIIPLPGAVWMFLMNAGLRPKSFSNLLELSALAVLLAGLLLLRAWVGTRIPRAISSLLLMFASLAISVGVFYFVPLIPE